MIWTTKQIEEALLIKLSSDAVYGKVQFNSQNIDEGDLFIAFPGQRNGHEFVADALKRGASGAIVSRHIVGIDQQKLIKVNDTIEALHKLSEYKLRTSKAKFIAVTGSVGKTSTKEAIKIMLGAYGNVHASYGTFNNFLGVPLTLASMPDNTDYAIIEMGMNAKGEISSLSSQVIPDVAVITSISEGHLECFNSIEEIADAKCEIFDGLDINDGTAIINRDVPVYERCIKNIDRVRLQNVQTFGKDTESDVQFILHEILDSKSTRLIYNVHEEIIEIIIDHIVPIHLAVNFAAAFAVVKALHLDINLAASAIPSFRAVLGRGQLVSIDKRDKSYQIICDYYNSNPQSLQASLEHLAQLVSNNKIAVLGDMRELGKKQILLHRRMIPYIRDSCISTLFLVGEIMQEIKNDLPSNISVQCYRNVDLLIAEIDQYVKGGELILIKGSRGLKLEKLARHLGVSNVL